MTTSENMSIGPDGYWNAICVVILDFTRTGEVMVNGQIEACGPHIWFEGKT